MQLLERARTLPSLLDQATDTVVVLCLGGGGVNKGPFLAKVIPQNLSRLILECCWNVAGGYLVRCHEVEGYVRGGVDVAEGFTWSAVMKLKAMSEGELM